MTDFFEDIVNFLISLKDGVLYFFPGAGRPDRVLDFMLGHLNITLVTLLLSILIGITLGVLITRVRVLYKPVITLAGIIYTIPSLALFGMMIPIVGIGFLPSIIALTLYSLLVLIRNTAVGIDSVSPAIIEAARGMGMTPAQILLRVELPLALPVIFAGIRITSVSTISLATLAAFFGTKSFGSLIFEGISAGGLRNDKIAAGAIGSALLAIAFSYGIGLIEKRLSERAALGEEA